MQDDDYKVFVDATILGRHDLKAPKNTWVAYVVEGTKDYRDAKSVSVVETDDAEYEAIRFAIQELKDKLPKFTIFCDHESVVYQINKYSNKIRKPKDILKQIQREIKSHGNIEVKLFRKNPAHTFLNKYLLEKRSMAESS